MASVRQLLRWTAAVPRMIMNGQWRQLAYKVGARIRGLDFDFVSVEELGLTHDRAVGHAGSGGPDLRSLLRILGLRPTDTIIDLGCGKAAALVTIAKFPHAKLSGVDISAELIAAARSNLDRLGLTHVTLWCCDATQFKDLDDYNYIYMYNPFTAVIMEPVLRNIAESLVRRPRKLTIIYKHPKCNDLFVNSSLFDEIRKFDIGDSKFNVYTHR